MKNTNTNNTAANTTTVEALLKQATEPSKQNAVAFHELWEEGKRSLSVADQARLWDGLTAIRKNDFAGKKFFKAHPEYAPSTPGWAKAPKEPEKHPIPAPKAPAKQEKPKADKPAKQEKPKADKPAKQAKPKEPTTKELLASMLTSMNALDQSMRSMAKTLDSMDKRLTKLEKSAR